MGFCVASISKPIWFIPIDIRAAAVEAAVAELVVDEAAELADSELPVPNAPGIMLP